MKANKVNSKAVPIKLTDTGIPDLQALYEYPEKENRIISGGSSHVLNDFLEFTDYLIPVYKRRHSITEDDYYSALNSI
jgi:hypothetical protein